MLSKSFLFTRRTIILRLGDLVIKQLNDVLDSYINKNFDKANYCINQSHFHFFCSKNLERAGDCNKHIIVLIKVPSDQKVSKLKNDEGKIFIIEDET